MPECNIIEVEAETDLFERLSQPSPATICLKRHPIVLMKVSSRSRGINSQGSEERVRVSCQRIAIHPCKKIRDPRGRRSSRRHGIAAFAWSEPCKDCFPSRGKVLNIARIGFACRTRRSTEDARRTNGKEEDTVMRGIACIVGALHFGGRGKSCHSAIHNQNETSHVEHKILHRKDSLHRKMDTESLRSPNVKGGNPPVCRHLDM